MASNAVDPPLDRADVVSIMEALFDIRTGVDKILMLIREEDDGDEPEEEEDS